MKTKRLIDYLSSRISLIARTMAIVSILGLMGCPEKKVAAPIRVGYLPIYADLPIFVAKTRGFFEKHNIAVEMIRFEASPDIGTALLNGKLDAGASVSSTVLFSLESRDPGQLRVYAVDAANKDNYLSSIVVLKSSSLKSVSQLKGKKIGSFPGPGAGTFGKMVLEAYGLKFPTDFEWIELAAPTHLSALETKTVDALFTYEPIATQAILEKNAEKLLPGAVERTVISPWQAGMWVLTRPFIERDPERARGFVRAIEEAIDFTRAQPIVAKEALTSFTSIKPQVAKAAVDSPFTKLGEVDIESLQKNADILTSKKVLSKRIDVAKMILPTAYAK